MAPRIKFTFKEGVVLALVIASFFLVLGKYLFPSIANYLVIRKTEAALSVKLQPAQNCPSDEVTIKLSGGVICRDQAASSTLLTIFDTYQLDPNGKEQMFSFIKTDDASQTLMIANDYLNNEYYVDRYNPVAITNLTWDEDPYNQEYWRFIFYSLRDEEYLLQAWQETGNPAYEQKFTEILQSFLTTGTNQPLAWSDPHAVAFRTMVLVDAWWELREYNSLPVELSNQILQSLEQNGQYLADPSNYEPAYNHAINEAGALFLLSVNFPDLPNANQWQTISEDRLTSSLDTAVDSDGVLLENSSYYHFYALEKYWEIFQYAKAQGIIFAADVQDKLQKMIAYATYVLQPDDQVPLLGASIERKVNFAGVDRDIALANPNFEYVLTQGKKGTQPSQLSVHYQTAGETIMRSGWGSGTDFANQTQLIFNVGPFRTNHSQLDGLAFSLYGQGIALMPGSGLYTYVSSTAKDYFWGTSSHNTVVVDGGNQSEGSPTEGTFKEGDGYTYETGESNLYNGVTHDRAIALLGQNLVLVVDNLKSLNAHTYDQMFHLFPGAQIGQNGLDITGYSASSSNEQITIHQLITNGVNVSTTINQMNPLDGVCSEQYGVLVPCYSVDYRQIGENAEFVTLLEIGKPNSDLKVQLSSDGSQVNISEGGESYNVAIGDIPQNEQPVKVLNNQTMTQTGDEAISEFADPSSWEKISQRINNEGTIASINASSGPILALTSPRNGSWVEAVKEIPLNLTDQNINLEMNIQNFSNLKNAELLLSTNDWTGSAAIRLNDFYSESSSNQWTDISLGKGQLRDVGGEWVISGTGFDWSNIDQVAFKINSSPGAASTLQVNDFSLIPGQSQGTVVVVFDNGYSSILPAAKIMQNLGLKGNVGAISGYLSRDAAGRLSVSDLQDLQNNYGWDVINESWYHYDPITEYYDTNNLAGLSQDILKGAEYLTENGINTDQNWYIYPDGVTNSSIEAVVGQYYKFARTTSAAPEVYPFGDPLAVKTFPTISDTTPPETVIKAIYDAQKYGLALFLTFRQIQTSPSDPAGYPLSNFQEIMQYIAQNKVNVETFSGLDASDGISQNTLVLAEHQPEQIGLQVTPKSTIFERLLAFAGIF